jgi:hypothetical protein
VRYKLDFSLKLDVSSPPVTGALVGASAPPVFVAWQPSTWPAAPVAVDGEFVLTLKRIFEESILGEINNVIEDICKSNGDLQHRGHVVAISLMCALDAVASYGYRKHHMAKFIRAHFRADYHPHANQIYKLYRCSLVHVWNLFEVAICPDDTKIKVKDGSLTIGLIDVFDCLVQATGDFLEKLTHDKELQKNTLKKYKQLRSTAKS